MKGFYKRGIKEWAELKAEQEREKERKREREKEENRNGKKKGGKGNLSLFPAFLTSLKEPFFLEKKGFL